MSFSLHLHFNTSFRAFPQSLRHFLRINNHLQHLQLDMTIPLPYPVDEEPLGAWLADLVNDNVHFPSLQTLNIYPSNTETGLSAFLNLIKLTVPTLTSLTVSGLWLNPGMATQVIDALTECEGQPKMLKSLTLKLTELSVPLLELVARKLPKTDFVALPSRRFRQGLLFFISFNSRWLIIPSFRIRFMICSASEDITVTTYPPKTYFIPGNSKISRFTGIQTEMTSWMRMESARWWMLYPLWLTWGMGNRF